MTAPRPFLVLVLLLLAACQAGPRVPAAPAMALPAQWSAAGPSDADRPSGDWEALGDALLARLVADALAANTAVAGAQARLRQAQALRDQAQAALRPRLSFSVSAQAGIHVRRGPARRGSPPARG